jgi:hypothetical protein
MPGSGASDRAAKIVKIEIQRRLAPVPTRRKAGLNLATRSNPRLRRPVPQARNPEQLPEVFNREHEINIRPNELQALGRLPGMQGNASVLPVTRNFVGSIRIESHG